MKKNTAWFLQEWRDYWEKISTSSRWHRGKTYAHTGKVTHLLIQGGSIKAHVKGSMLYQTSIESSPPGTDLARQIREAFRQDFSLLIGVYQQTIQPQQTADYPLHLGFYIPPLTMHCTCSDTILPCKHVIAVALAALDFFAEDYTLFLQFTGLILEQVLSYNWESGTELSGTGEQEHYERVPLSRATAFAEGKWVNKEAPNFWLSSFPFTTIIREIYAKVGEERKSR